MVWSVTEVFNSLKISKPVADLLFKAQGESQELWHSVDEITTADGFLSFNPEQGEHTDYLSSHEDIRAALKRVGASGVVAFSAQGSDTEKRYWGYEFTARGWLKYLGKKQVLKLLMDSQSPCAAKTLIAQDTESAEVISQPEDPLYTNETVVDVIDCEGLGYAVQYYFKANMLDDKKLQVLWQRAADALSAIETYLGMPGGQ